MSDSTKPPFAFEGTQLIASALHAQLLARRRATFEHDLKNIIHGLLSGTELLGKALATNSPRIPPAECLALLQQQLNRAQSTLHHILEQVAPDDAPPSTIELAMLVDECAHDLRHQLQRFDLVLQIEPQLKVRASRTRLKNVLLFALLESLDRSPLHSTLTLSAQRASEDSIELQLRHSTTNSPTAQAFASLAMLLELDDGRIEVTTTSDARTVSIRLPSVSDASAQPTLGRLLIVDSNRDSADSLAMLLQLEGYDAHAAYDASSAVRTAQAQPADALVLDLDGPIDVASLITQLRAEEPTLRIYGLSHTTEPRISQVDAQLRKPLDPQVLRATLGARNPG